MNKFKLWFSKTYISNEISWHGWRYGIAVLAVALATAIKFLLLHLFAIESPFLVMLVAVMVSALYGGMRAGVLATVLSALISYYLFISPTYMFIGKPTGQNLRLIIFITEGLLISRIISALKYTQRRLKLEEVSLRQSEELNRLMVDAVQDYAIFMLDPDGYVVNWNKGAQRLKGYRANEIVGQHFSGFYVQEEIEQRLPELALQQAAVNGWVEHEGWRVRKDSSRFWANVVITALRDEAGKLRGFSQVTRDMTDRKQAQEQLANVNTILEQRVQERTAQLDQAKNEAQLGFNRLNGIIESTKDLIVALDLDFRFVAFNSAYKQEFAKVNGKQIELGMSIIDVLAHLPTEQAKARETWGRALRGEEFTIIEQFGEPNKLEFGYYEVNCNPIKDENEQLIGACQRVRDVSDRIRAETEIRNLNHELEERVIERTQALEAQIQERIKIEVNLRESEDRFRTLADNISQLAWMADAQGWIFWYNRRWFEYTGTTLEEMQGWGWQKVHHPDHVNRVVKSFSDSLNTGEPWEDTFPLRGKDNQFRWFLSRALPIRDEQGNIVRWFGTNTDIQDIKLVQDALRESEEKFRATFNQAAVGIAHLSIDGSIQLINQKLCDILGYTEAELKKLTVPDITYPDDLEADIQNVQRMLANEIQFFSMEKRYIRKDGSLVWGNLTASIVREEIPSTPLNKGGNEAVTALGKEGEGGFGEPKYFIGVVEDISDRKQAQAALEAKTREITNIFESISDAVSILDSQWRYIYVNAKAEKLLGKTKNELIGKNMWELFPHVIDWPGYEYCHRAMAEQVTIEYEEYHPNLEKWLGVRLYPSTEGLAIYFRDITDRKQTEIALQLSEAKFRRLADANVVGIITANYVGEIKEANDAFLQMIGYTREDLNAGLVQWRYLTPPEYIAEDERIWEQIIKTGTFAPFEKEYIRKDGTRVPIMAAGALLQGNQPSTICIIVDLTERRQAELAVQQSEKHFRNLADSMPQIVWTANPDGTVDYYNQRVREFSSFLEKQDGSWQWESVLHPDDQQRTIETWQQAVETGEIYECEHRVKKIDGEFRWHLSRGMSVKDEQGRIVKWYGTATDIHTQKQYQAEREELLQREQAARTEAELASRLKDEFLATLSHELRTPMNAMLGWTRMLRTRKMNEATAARALETIERNTKILNQLIEDILDVSLIIRGKVRLNLQPLQVLPVIEQAIEIVKPTAEAKDIQILVQPLPGSSLKVMADSSRLQQIVWNLLSNAIKFTPNGGYVTVRLSALDENPGVEEDFAIQNPLIKQSMALSKIQNCYAQIQVVDTGMGITPEFLPFVFDRFRQADGSITRSHGGLGLGLAIVRHLVELHGGTVEVHSLGAGQGATFTVNLPLVVQSNRAIFQDNGEDGIQSYSDTYEV